MSNMNELETQLRSWTPRRPSEAIEARLFPRPERRAAHRPPTLAWLAPVTAGIMLTAMILNQHGVGSMSDGNRSETMITASLSNQSYVPYIPNSYQPANNRLDTFEWTNAGGSTSPMHFRSPQGARD